MKKLITFFLILFVLFVLVIGGALFVVTRPSFQKNLIESRLPEGSSLKTVRVTMSSLEISELKLVLPDKNQVRLKTVDVDFKPLAALFDNTIKFGALNVDGLVVELQEPLIAGNSLEEGMSMSAADSSTPSILETSTSEVAVGSAQGESLSPFDVLYTIGQLEWLFDIDSIRLNGELRDSTGSIYGLTLKSGSIRPGEESTIEASLKLSSSQALHAGLREFDASAEIFLKQNADGGFEKVRIESKTNASDGAGNSLLAVEQILDLEVKSFNEEATVDLEFEVDLPRPEVFIPEMVGVGGLGIEGELLVDVRGEASTLKKAQLLVTSDTADVVSVDLKKEFTFGETKDLSGDLMDITLTNLPMAWLSPWIPEYALSGQDINAQFNMTGLADGALKVSSLVPLQLGPLSLSQGGELLLDQITLRAQPVIQIAADHTIVWDLGELEILDRYGEIITGQSRGKFKAPSGENRPLPYGLETETNLDIGLQQMMQQPLLSEYTSITRGRALVDLSLTPSADYPVKLQAQIEGLSVRGYPGQRQDYRFAVQMNEPKPDVLAAGANILAGSAKRPSTTVQIAGQLVPDPELLKFKLDLKSDLVQQRDIDFLASAFSPRRKADSEENFPETKVSTGPAWANLDGQISIEIKELLLLSKHLIQNVKAKVVVNESLLRLQEIAVSAEEGRLSGTAEIRYKDNAPEAYAFETDLTFKDINPAIFVKRRSGSFPVQGLFDGDAKFSGNGQSLVEALEGIEGELAITGREGILTAFELGNKSQIGLIGAGLLGQQIDQPGMTAFAQAVPYFEEMVFSDFSLKLLRDSDKRIIIPELRFIGDNVLINGSGLVAATSFKELLDQPLDLNLEFGAKGALVDYLETLRLLGPDTSEDGFRRWNRKIDMGGSLGDPDSSALKRILNEAARRAVKELTEPSKDSANSEDLESTPEGESKPREKSKEEILLEGGLDLIDSLF